MKFDRFDYFVLSILATLLLVLGALIGIGDQVGAQVTATFPAEGAAIAPHGAVGAAFAQAMQAESVAAHFSLSPTVPGQMQWNNQQMTFRPTAALQPGITYTARLAAGALSQNGRALKNDLTWSFTARTPQVLYLSPASKGTLDLVALTANGPISLTQTNGDVYDYAAAPDGEQIVYSVLNELGGLDLWLMARDGSNQRMLVDCGPGRCSVPSWSPESDRIAYSREEEGLAPGAPPGPPRVWTVQVDTGQTLPLYQDSQILGYGPIWSPNGQRLAFFDGSVGGIRVLDLASGGEMVLPTLMGLVGAFSPDSGRMFFTDIQTQQQSVVSVLYLADLQQQTITRPISDTLPFSDFGTPAWSPDGEWLALSARSPNSGPGRQLWLLRADGSDMQPITQDPKYTFGSYHWDDWGEHLLYQRVALSTPYPQPELFMWSRSTGAAQLLAVDGTLPNWLP